jgi:hypothetical protein
MSLPPCGFVLRGELSEVALESVVEFDNNIDIAFGVNIRVVAIRALEENAVAFTSVGVARIFEHFLDRVVGRTGTLDCALM